MYMCAHTYLHKDQDGNILNCYQYYYHMVTLE